MLPRVPKNVSVIRTLRTQPISLAQDVTHPLRPTLLQGGTPMQVREFMSKDPVCCNPESSLGDVARLMVDHHCGDGRRTRNSGKLVGVVTDRDITCRTVAQGRTPLELTAKGLGQSAGEDAQDK